MVKSKLYEYWGFNVNDDYEVMIPEGAIPLEVQGRSSGKKPRILCLVPKSVAEELDEDEEFTKKWSGDV